MTESLLIFYLLLFVVAFLYSSVGHGGASGYLAIMAIFSVTPAVMRPTALVLNLFVSLTAFFQFYRAGHFKLRLFTPFAVASVLTSFLGGLVHINGEVYKKILGALLLIPVFRFLFFANAKVEQIRPAPIGWSLAIGGIIGFLSGLIGIGGGIILSPVLLLLKWADQKQAAATSAAFIFVNSIAGLAGQLVHGVTFTANMYFYIVFAFAGGLLGAWYGAKLFSHTVLKNVLATVLAFAAFKLLYPGS